jgi:hypothetical protein
VQFQYHKDENMSIYSLFLINEIVFVNGVNHSALRNYISFELNVITSNISTN